MAADGAVRYCRGVTQTPVWVTGEALMALEGKPLPIAAPAPPPVPAQPAHEHAHRDRGAVRAPVRAVSGLDGEGERRQACGCAHSGPRARAAAIAAQARVANSQKSGAAGNFAHAVGVITALALAPVGLG